ncbi:MAG: alcohol dehydrogenase catalytic domain-containing protein [Thaumarchaeota archaeon]|nr:alcohol dehydrogenase catalytic domain-containing protein [Nitrososphaerota archaeon]
MKALVLNGLAPVEKGPLEFREFDDPMVGPGEVLLRVSACGVCHSNLHLVEGDLKLYGIPATLPIIPRHEVVGVVAGIGHSVKGVEMGQRVGVSVIWKTCGRCEYCLSGDENLCPERVISGEHVNGGSAGRRVRRARHVYYEE